MHFAATLPGRSLPEVLKLCASKGVDASLEVSGPQVSSTLWFKAGQIVFAQSASSLALGEALSRLSLVGDDKLAEVRAASPAFLEEAIITRQWVKPQVITYIRAFQIAETIYQILEWDKAGFELREGSEATPLRFVHPDYLPQNYDWLGEVNQYGNEWPAIRQSIGTGRTVLQRGPNPAPENLAPQELKLVELVDGKRSVHEVVLWSGMNFIAAHRLLTNLADRMIIAPKEGTNPGAKPRNEKGIQEVLRNIIRLPGGKSVLLLDRRGQLIAQAHADGGEHEGSAMASIFARTVGDFEQHLSVEDESHRIEQILVEHKQGNRTVLVATNRIILAVEAARDCDWGLLRLESGRAVKALGPMLGG